MDKRPFYVWIFAILANIGTYLAIVCLALMDGHYGIDAWIASVMTKEILLLIGGSLFVSVVPVWLSDVNFKYRNCISYGIPLLIIFGSLSHSFTCNGWFCNLIDIPIIFGCGIFIIFYTLGKYLRQWNIRVVSTFLWIEIVFLIIFTLFNIYSSRQNLILSVKLDSLQAEVQNTNNPADLAKICDSFPDSSRSPLRSECWKKAMALSPDTDVCRLSEDLSSKKECLFYQGLLNQNICEGKDSLISYEKRGDQNENIRLAQCWRDKAKMYPELNICQWVYEWNREKCIEVVNISTE